MVRSTRSTFLLFHIGIAKRPTVKGKWIGNETDIMVIGFISSVMTSVIDVRGPITVVTEPVTPVMTMTTEVTGLVSSVITLITAVTAIITNVTEVVTDFAYRLSTVFI